LTNLERTGLKKTPHDEYNPWTPYVLLTLTVLFWSGNFVLGRGIRELIPPVSLNFWRWVGAFAILLPFGLPRVRRQRELIVRHWKYLALMSIPSIAIFNAFIYTALQSTTTTNTVLVNAMVPVFIAVTAWFFFRDRLGVRQVAGVAISFSGLVFIIARGDISALQSLDFSRGDLWTLGAGISWAVYSVMLRKRPSRLDLIAFLTVIVAFGLLFSAPFYAWEIWAKGGFALKPASYASIAYVCVFPSVLAYIFWNRAVLMVGPNRAGIFFHLMPVFSIVMASVFLGESLFYYHLIGMLLIFTGIALTTIPGARPGR
jgi:drug/metabolite transporter (DMT)-like permease